MSLSTLARDEILRKDTNLTPIQDARIALAREKVKGMFAPSSGPTPEQTASLDEDLIELATSEPVQETTATTILEALVKYIPTESVTLYVAAVSAMAALNATVAPHLTAKDLYWLFAVLTPVLFLLIYAGKRRGNSLPPFPPFRDWPWWKLVASTVAFLAWALAVPGGPYLSGEHGGTVAALIALFVSTILSILAAVIEKPVPG